MDAAPPSQQAWVDDIAIALRADSAPLYCTSFFIGQINTAK